MTTGGPAPRAAPGRRRATRPARSSRAGRSGALGRPNVPRPSVHSTGWRYTLLVAALLLVVGWTVWYAMTPEDLPVDDQSVSASGVVGTPLYVGMFGAPKDFERAIRIAGVKVHTTSNVKIEVTPLLCRRGTVGVTTKPGQFCNALVNPEGQRLDAGDSIVLRVESDEPALAIIDRIRIAYREDLRWDTQPAGKHQAIVSIAGGTAPE